MRASKFKPQDYLQRFADGIAFYDGLPYKVMTDGARINLYCLATGDLKYQSVQNDEKLDVSSPPLGYVNTKNGAIYLARVPHRRYKQCVDHRAVQEHMLTPTGHQAAIQRLATIYSVDFFNSFAKPYPTLEVAVKKLNSGVQSVAISRDFGVTLDELGIIKVWYKSDLVGWVDPKNLKLCKVPDVEKGFLISYFLSDAFGWEVE